MIHLLEINEFQLKKYVEIAYEGDDDLLNLYHVDVFDFDSAVNETLKMIEVTSAGINMRYFGVISEGNKIGYLCTFQNNLYSFAINIKNRTKDILIEFWGKIKKVLGESFICMLYPNNIRAIAWCKRCGMVEVKDVEDNIITLLNVK